MVEYLKTRGLLPQSLFSRDLTVLNMLVGLFSIESLFLEPEDL